MAPDPAQREGAIARLVALGGLSQKDAERLVDAALDGAIDQALEMINGSGPVPTSMATSKADQLRFICGRADRLLTQREVEIIFRITATAARNVMATMLATYQEGLREKFLARMRSDVRVSASGTKDTSLKWTLRFSEPGILELAWAEIERLGLAADTVRDTGRKTLVVPRSITDNRKRIDPLKLLGIPKP